MKTTGYYDAFIARFNLDFSYVGIKENNTNSHEMTIFPNPTNGHVTISVDFVNKNKIQIKLFNLMGQLLTVDELKTQNDKMSYDMDLSSYSSGMYIVNVIIGDSMISQKIIKN